MRLRTLTLTKYGNFEGERIGFDPTPGVVNLLLAPNGAGKSVLRNAFGDLLYGIGNQTDMGFRHGYTGMRVTADIVQRDGTLISFSRPKSRGNIVTDADGNPRDADFLFALLGGRDRKLLERLFSLDTESLREGGRALLESGGDIASALLSAAGGIRQARALKRGLEEQRDALAPERRTASRPFYQALDGFNDSRRRVRDALLRPDEWQRQENALIALEETRQARIHAMEQASAEITRLERVRRVRPWLAQLTAAEAWLADHPDAPRLDTGLSEVMTNARMHLAASEEADRQARARLAAATQDADAAIVDDALLARADPIRRLINLAGEGRKAREDLPGIREQRDLGLARIADLLRELGSPLEPARVTEVLPTRAALTRTRRLIDRHTTLSAAARDLPARIESRRRELAALETRLAGLAPEQDLQSLETNIEEIRAGGDPAARAAEAAKRIADAAAELERALARVPGWTGTPNDLAALRPLTLDAFRRQDGFVTDAARDAHLASDRLDEAGMLADQARAALVSTSGGGTIPDEAALAAARAHREQGWRLIYRRAFTADPPSSEEETAFTADAPLPLAFERAMRQADAIADRRAVESDALARIDAARRALTEAEARADHAAERMRLANEKIAQSRRAWEQLCAPLGMGDAASLSDVQIFLDARERAVDAMRDQAAATDAATALRQRHAAWATTLASVLNAEPADLPALLTQAARVLTQARRAQRERTELETKRAQAAKELEDDEMKQASATEANTAFLGEWRKALAELGRPAEEEPDVTAAVLDTLKDIGDAHTRTAELTARVNGMTADIDRFSQDVDAERASLAAMPLDPDPFEAVRTLGTALSEGVAAGARRDALRKALDNARAGAAVADQQRATARNTLSATLDLIGAETVEDAEQRLSRSADRARQEADRDEAAGHLRETGAGLAVEALREEAEAVPPDSIDARIDVLTTQRSEAMADAQRTTAEVTTLRDAMRRDQDATGVNQAAQDQQSAVATLSRTLDDAVVYHVASLLLGRALEIVEQSGDSAMLNRLSAIFQDVTHGVYTRVTTEPDDAGAARLALVQRDYPSERQTTSELSEGTRDQLFLSLRVAAIEDHLNSAEPLPFIGDDILQTFDDDRALAALRVLTDLSHHTQVVLLSHHRHFLDLATRLPAGSVYQCPRGPAVTSV